MLSDSDANGHEEAYASSRRERDRTLEAVHRLESALSMAASGSNWLAEVRTDLQALEVAMADEQRELNRPDALLAMIAAEHPRRFSWRIRSLQEQYDDLIRQVKALQVQLDEMGDDTADPTDLRNRAGGIVRSLHNCRARQSDIVFEALRLDLGAR